MNEILQQYLKKSGEKILSYYSSHPYFALEPKELEEGTFVYFLRGGKRLRPAICRLAAGALGGVEAEEDAIPCALALELYHNWTLVHDDMIDHDDTRRGKMAVHKLIATEFSSFGDEISEEYGLDTALLAGDALHSASVYYLSLLSESGNVPAEVTLRILSLLEGKYGPRLISGETLDTRNALLYGKDSFFRLSREEILTMMAGKTGALFAISAISGALIGQKSADETAPAVKALGDFAESCGIAFQLQDDILGITSTRETLGKPIGSDLREGKPTLLLLTVYENATEEEKAFLRQVVGKSKDEGEIAGARTILLNRGGVEETEKVAAGYLKKAKESLALLPPSHDRDCLAAWQDFMLHREY